MFKTNWKSISYCRDIISKVKMENASRNKASMTVTEALWTTLKSQAKIILAYLNK